MLGNFFTYVASEASAIADAPLIFLMAVLASAAIVWWLLKLRFGGTIDSQRERLQARDEKIADYKAKLEGAEPEEARARIVALEARIARLEPRRLSEHQREALTPHLRTARGAIMISADTACSDGQVFARDFEAAFQEAGWKVSKASVMGIPDPPASGISIAIADLNNPTDIDKAVFAAMEAAGVAYEKRRLRGVTHCPRNAEILITSVA